MQLNSTLKSFVDFVKAVCASLINGTQVDASATNIQEVGKRRRRSFSCIGVSRIQFLDVNLIVSDFKPENRKASKVLWAPILVETSFGTQRWDVFPLASLRDNIDSSWTAEMQQNAIFLEASNPGVSDIQVWKSLLVGKCFTCSKEMTVPVSEKVQARPVILLEEADELIASADEIKAFLDKDSEPAE